MKSSCAAPYHNAGCVSGTLGPGPAPTPTPPAPGQCDIAFSGASGTKHFAQSDQIHDGRPVYTFTPGGSSPDLLMFFYANAKSWQIGHGFDGAYSHSCFWSNYQDQATPDQIPGKWVYGPDYASCEWGQDMKSTCFDRRPVLLLE